MSAPLASIRIPSFLGLQTNRDPREVQPGGAASQKNVSTQTPGKLSVRQGVQPYTFSSTATLATGLNTFRRIWCCRARFGDLFIVNGIDAPLRWDGMTATAEAAGIEAPAAAPSVTPGAGGAATAGTYYCYYRYIDDTLPTGIPGNLSPVAEVTAAENDQFDWSDIPASLPGRAYKVELWRSVADEPNVLYKIATLNEGTTTYSSDDASDNDLLASSDEDTLKILLEDGSINANRFVPPPSDRSIMVMYQDRYWFAGNVNYNQGTVSTVAGNVILGGVGTGWTDGLEGRYIRIEGEPAPLKISAVGNATAISLETAPTTTGGGKGYVIYANPENRRKLLYSEVDEPESVPTTNTVTIQENTGDDDEITGLIPRGSYLFVMTERHRYAITYARQPRIDAAVSLIDDRGLINQFCWDSFDDVIFCLDDAGPYIFRGSSRAEPIDADIHNFWRDGTIDFTKKENFSVRVDRRMERVYFFVVYAEDQTDLPRRALVYNVRTGTWDHFEYPQQIGSAAQAEIDGESRLFLASENSTVHLADEGTTDVVPEEIRGTVTSATGTTLSDSTASFSASVIGAAVYIYEGTGKGQRRTITARTSTQLTVATWGTTPDTTSKYIIGAIPWDWKTGRMPLVNSPMTNERSVRLAFPPTDEDYRIDLRLYWNYDTTPETQKTITRIQQDAVYVDEDNPTDVVVTMKKDQSDLEDRVGYEQFRFDGRMNDRSHTDRCLSVELRGFQGDEEIIVDEVEVVGVIGEQK